jgi:uncharacterized protein YbjT (DUF2867 family)
MSGEPVLVLGATGTQGGAVARGLGAAGLTVGALVRDPKSERAMDLQRTGVRLVVGDLLDPGSLTRAFAEFATVYAVTTPFADGAAAEERQGASIIAAAAAAHLPWLIFASVAAADRAPVPHFQSKARIEQRLAATDLTWTVIAPSYFYENVLGSRDAIGRGQLELALPPDRPLHQVGLTDLGRLVAAVMARRDEHIHRRVEVAADAPTPETMAVALGVRYERLALDAVRQRSADLAAMYEFLTDEGYGIDVARLRATYPEVPWTTFAEFARGVDWSAQAAV